MPPLHGPGGVCSLLVFVAALITSTQGRPRACGLGVIPADGLVQILPGKDASVICGTNCNQPLRHGEIFWRDPRGQRVPEHGLQRATRVFTVNYNRWTVSRLLIHQGQQQDSGVYTCELQFGSRLLQYPVTIQIEDTTTRDPGPQRGDIYIHPEPDLSPIRIVRSASRQARQSRHPRSHRKNTGLPVSVPPQTLIAQPAQQSPPLADAAGNKNVVKVNDILFEFDPEVSFQDSNHIIGGEDGNDSIDEDEAEAEGGEVKKRVRRRVNGDVTGHFETATEAQSGVDTFTGGEQNTAGYYQLGDQRAQTTDGNQNVTGDQGAHNSTEYQLGDQRAQTTYGNQNVADDQGAQATDFYPEPMNPNSMTSFDQESNQSNATSSSTPANSSLGFSTTGSAGLPLSTSSGPSDPFSFDSSTPFMISPTPFVPLPDTPPATSSESTPVPGRNAATDIDTTTTDTTTTTADPSTTTTTTVITTSESADTATTPLVDSSEDENEDAEGEREGEGEGEGEGEVVVGGDTFMSKVNGDGETDFGRYGMLAFGLMLGVALLLLYALLLVIFVPRCCKKRDSHDFTTASTKRDIESGGNSGVFAMAQRSHTPLGPMSSATGLNGEYITSVDLDAAASSPTPTTTNNNQGGGAENDAGSEDDKPSGGGADDPKKEDDAKPESESSERFVSSFLIGRLSSSKPTEGETLPPDSTMASDDNVFAENSPTSGEASASTAPSAKPDSTGHSDDGEHPLDSSDANTSSSSSDSKDASSSAPDLADKEGAKGDDLPLAPLAKAESGDSGLMSEIKLTVDPAGIFVSKPTDV